MQSTCSLDLSKFICLNYTTSLLTNEDFELIFSSHVNMRTTIETKQ